MGLPVPFSAFASITLSVVLFAKEACCTKLLSKLVSVPSVA